MYLTGKLCPHTYSHKTHMTPFFYSSFFFFRWSGCEVWHPLCKQAARAERRLRVSQKSVYICAPEIEVKFPQCVTFPLSASPQHRRLSETSISPPGSSIGSPSRVICVSKQSPRHLNTLQVNLLQPETQNDHYRSSNGSPRIRKAALSLGLFICFHLLSILKEPVVPLWKESKRNSNPQFCLCCYF